MGVDGVGGRHECIPLTRASGGSNIYHWSASKGYLSVQPTASLSAVATDPRPYSSRESRP